MDHQTKKGENKMTKINLLPKKEKHETIQILRTRETAFLKLALFHADKVIKLQDEVINLFRGYTNF